MTDTRGSGGHTYHTTNPVPLIYMSNDPASLRDGGALKDIAPTVLGILGVAQPEQMKGTDLRLKRS